MHLKKSSNRDFGTFDVFRIIISFQIPTKNRKHLLILRGKGSFWQSQKPHLRKIVCSSWILIRPSKSLVFRVDTYQGFQNINFANDFTLIRPILQDLARYICKKCSKSKKKTLFTRTYNAGPGWVMLTFRGLRSKYIILKYFLEPTNVWLTYIFRKVFVVNLARYILISWWSVKTRFR